MMIGTKSRMEMHGIAVFDVCGTITKTNNTSDFIGFVLRGAGVFPYLRLVFLRVLCLSCRIPALRRFVSESRLRERQIALLRGYSPSRLRESARLYAEALFARGLVNDRILAAIEQEKEQRREVVLVSAAIDPPVAAIAERLGVREFISSELEIVDGCCTGRLKGDLLCRKQSVVDRLAAIGDLKKSAVYSDNPEDAVFMENFASRYAVLNTRAAERQWDIRDEGFQYLANYGAARSESDIGSINDKTHKWIYIPLLYYILSRFHRSGLASFLLREVVPAALAGFLFTSLSVFSLVVMPLSFLAFYCVYEIGGLANDLLVGKETSGRGTCRISPGVRIHVPLFVVIRIAAVSLILAWLPLGVRPLLVYAGLLLLCLAIYLAHSVIAAHWRIATFSLLKLCRSCIPLVALASYVPLATLVWLCAIFFLIDAPWRLYMYCRQGGLIQTEASISRVRCANVLVLWTLGVLICCTAGLPHLLILASYHVVLECLWGICAILPGGMVVGRSRVNPCS